MAMFMHVVSIHVYVHARNDVSIYPMSVSMLISVSMPKSVSFSVSVSMSVPVSEFVFVSMSMFILLFIFRVTGRVNLNVHVHVSVHCHVHHHVPTVFSLRLSSCVSISVSPSLFPRISISALSLCLSAAIFGFLAPCVSSSLSIYLCLFPSVSSPQSLFFCISAMSLPLRLPTASLHPSLPSICPFVLSLVSQPLSYPLYLCYQSLPFISLLPLSFCLSISSLPRSIPSATPLCLYPFVQYSILYKTLKVVFSLLRI